jgi:hypothetical protein
MKELSYFFKIIFYILIVLSIFYVISLFIYPQAHFENNIQEEKLHISESKIEANKPCFYIDKIKNIESYRVSSIDVRDENFDEFDEIVWFLGSHVVEHNAPLEREIKLSAIVGEKNCITYGDTTISSKENEAKPLRNEVDYQVSFYANSLNNQISEEIVFTNKFKLHKNQSTGKTEIEIVDN